MDRGKLAPCSTKCVLIGYFGHDAYWLFDKSTGKTYRSQDVIFEEGIGHCTLSAPPVSNKGETDHVVLQPSNDTQPISNTGLVPTQLTLPQPPTQQPPTQPAHQTVIRHSTHAKHLSEALIRSETLEREFEEAALLGKKWAVDNAAGVQSTYSGSKNCPNVCMFFKDVYSMDDWDSQ